jgi:hypothetical protein
MTRTTTPILDTTDRDRRVLATLAQQRGNIDDVVVDDGHAPDAIDAQALGHCRVTVHAGWDSGRSAAV